MFMYMYTCLFNLTIFISNKNSFKCHTHKIEVVKMLLQWLKPKFYCMNLTELSMSNE